MDVLEWLTEKTKATPTCMHCLGGQWHHPWLGKVSLTLIITVTQGILSKTYSAMPELGFTSSSSWLRGHPVLWWTSPAHSGNDSQWSHISGACFLSVASLCSSNSDWFTFFPRGSAHSIAFSLPFQSSWSGFLIILQEDLATSWVLQLCRFLSVFPLLMRLAEKVFRKVL